MNGNLFVGFSRVFEFSHPFKGFVSCLCVVILSCFSGMLKIDRPRETASCYRIEMNVETTKVIKNLQATIPIPYDGRSKTTVVCEILLLFW
jgi:hypothetical protein